MAGDLHRLALEENNRAFLPDEVFETEAAAARII